MTIYSPAEVVEPYYADDGLTDHAPSEAAKLRLIPAEYRRAAEEEMWRRTADVQGTLTERSEVARKVRTEVLLEIAAQLLGAR